MQTENEYLIMTYEKCRKEKYKLFYHCKQSATRSVRFTEKHENLEKNEMKHLRRRGKNLNWPKEMMRKIYDRTSGSTGAPFIIGRIQGRVSFPDFVLTFSVPKFTRPLLNLLPPVKITTNKSSQVANFSQPFFRGQGTKCFFSAAQRIRKSDRGTKFARFCICFIPRAEVANVW